VSIIIWTTAFAIGIPVEISRFQPSFYHSVIPYLILVSILLYLPLPTDPLYLFIISNVCPVRVTASAGTKLGLDL
jgi:hypothetical protein